MKLENIREFLVLAEELNYSIAARKLFISQSALSKHIAVLEEEMGVQLFQRTTHYSELTVMGKEAYKSLKNMMNQYDSLLELMRSYGSKATGKLVLGLLYYSVDDYFSEFIPMLRKQHPNMEIECKTYQPHEMYRDLLIGKIDIGEMPVGNFPESDKFRFHKFLSSSMVAVMHEDHPLAIKENITLEELKNEILIELKDDFCSRIVGQEMLEKSGVVFSKVIQTEHLETIAFAIKESGGIHLTGESCKKQNCRGLKYIPIKDKKFIVDNAFIYRIDNSNPLIPIFLKEADLFYKVLDGDFGIER